MYSKSTSPRHAEAEPFISSVSSFICPRTCGNGKRFLSATFFGVTRTLAPRSASDSTAPPPRDHPPFCRARQGNACRCAIGRWRTTRQRSENRLCQHLEGLPQSQRHCQLGKVLADLCSTKRHRRARTRMCCLHCHRSRRRRRSVVLQCLAAVYREQSWRSFRADWAC